MHYQDRVTFIVMNLILTGIAAVAGGTVLWLLWDGTITAIFPTAVSNGIVSEHLDWWPAVKFVWICSLLFKTTVRAPKPPKNKEEKNQEKKILHD